MSRNVVFMLAIVVGMASSSFAQSLQWTAPAVSSPRGSAKNIPIVLDARWLTASDNLDERVGPGLEKLPAMGAGVVRGKEQTDLLFLMLQSDKRSNAGPPSTISLLSGQKSEFAPFGPDRNLQGKDSIQATVSDDWRTVEIQVTWAKWKDGTERLPPTTAAVPIGSHLLIHTHELSESRTTPVSLWQQMIDRIFHQKRATVWRERTEGYILISPRPVLRGEMQTRTAAR